MNIDNRNIKMWSTIGSRATFGLAAFDLAKKIDDLIIVTADVSTSAGLDRFKKTYPEKYIDVGIAEQNMIGIATGLSSEGYNVITTTFSPFQTLRCCEQIKVNLGYMKHKVCLVGLASGLVLGTLGFTHCSIEDVGVLRSIPNITIISPADGLETIKAVEAATNHDKSVYIRLTGGSNAPIIYNEDYDFEIGKGVELKEGDDVSIFSSGAIISECLLAANELEKKNISCRVVNMHTIKPLDEEILYKSLNSKLIVSVEEHNIIGGLGSAISEKLSRKEKKPKHLILGVNDYYEKGGSYNYLLDLYGLKSKKIVETIILNLNQNV